MHPLLILAAGEGRRMRAVKPLVNLLGLSLLERTILTFRDAGINEFYVVVGYEKGRVKKHVEEIKEKYGIDIKIIENEQWKKGNGTSVLAAKGKLKKFFVTMVDHVFDVAVIKDFVERVKEGNYLLVDKDIKNVFDVEEATKVKIKDGKIVDIGKDLKDFNAIDTGLFFFNEDIFHALEKSLKKEGSLTAGVKILAKEGKIYGIEKKKGYWIDADTRENLKIAEKLILKSLPKKEDGFISFYLNRYFSIKISRYLSNFNISPTTITILSFLISLAGSILFMFNIYLLTILAGALIQFASIIDGCDGEIARMKFMATPYGAWLDTILDRYADAIITIFVTYNAWINYKSMMIWILGFISLLAFVMASYLKKEYELRYQKKLYGKMNKFSKRDVRLFSIFLGSIFNMPFYFMLSIAILHHVAIVYYLIKERK